MQGGLAGDPKNAPRFLDPDPPTPPHCCASFGALPLVTNVPSNPPASVLARHTMVAGTPWLRLPNAQVPFAAFSPASPVGMRKRTRSSDCKVPFVRGSTVL